MNFKLLKAIVLILLANISTAQEIVEKKWDKTDWSTEQMQKLSKQQCMDKTFMSIYEGCNNEQCILNLAGLTGDCFAVASGNAAQVCEVYRKRYMGFCYHNKLDGRSCWALSFFKDEVCQRYVKTLSK
jgi:hypothetical protein